MSIPIHIQFARELRKNQTPEEKIIWERVRNRQLKGFKFLRQHPIQVCSFTNQPGFYIADFYCASGKLAVEIDGNIHSFRVAYDRARDILIRQKGIHCCG